MGPAALACGAARVVADAIGAKPSTIGLEGLGVERLRTRRTRLATWCHYWYHSNVAATRKILDQMRREPANVRFADLAKVCESYFGKSRQVGTSHSIFKTLWVGDPRINIQDDKGKAKPYQVRQVLLAIQKLEDMRNAR